MLGGGTLIQIWVFIGSNNVYMAILSLNIVIFGRAIIHLHQYIDG